MAQLARFSATTPGDPPGYSPRREARTEDVWINPEHVVWVGKAEGAPRRGDAADGDPHHRRHCHRQRLEHLTRELLALTEPDPAYPTLDRSRVRQLLAETWALGVSIGLQYGLVADAKLPANPFLPADVDTAGGSAV
jgi:hypothetical protein